MNVHGKESERPRHGPTSIRSAVGQRRCVLLLISLGALLLLYPYLSGRSVLNDLLVSLILITGAYAVSLSRRQFVIALVLLLPALASRWLGLAFTVSGTGVFIHATFAAFCVYVIVMVFARVFRSRVITADTLAGAVSVYLLIGLTFASLYGIIEFIDPDAFVRSAPLSDGRNVHWQSLIFFSFVTMTTLGYGDIIPVSTKAQSLAIIESATGVVFMGVLVAWLVNSMQTTPPAEDQPGHSPRRN